MLQANAVILPVVNLFNGCASVEQTLILTGDCLREMPQPVPLTALLCESRPSINILLSSFRPSPFFASFLFISGGEGDTTYEDSW